MDVSKNELSLAFLIGAFALGTVAVIVDGPQGEQIITALVGLIGTMGGYFYGVSKCAEVK